MIEFKVSFNQLEKTKIFQRNVIGGRYVTRSNLLGEPFYQKWWCLVTYGQDAKPNEYEVVHT